MRLTVFWQRKTRLPAEVFVTLLYTGAPDATGCRQANAEHRKMVERLLARDPEGAAQAMTEHIEAAWCRRRLPSAAPPAP